MPDEIVKVQIEGQDVIPPLDIDQLSYKATFDNGRAEATISTTELTFVLDAAKMLHEHRIKGLSGGPGIFEGPCIKVLSENIDNTLSMFDGYVDMANDTYVERDFKGLNFTDPTEVIASLKSLSSLDDLESRAEANSAGYLESIGVFTDEDYVPVKWVIDQPFDVVGFVLTVSVTYTFVKEVSEAIERISNRINDVQAHTAGGATGPIAAAIFLALSILIELAYIAIMLAQVINLMEKMITNMISPVREHQGIRLKTLLEKSMNHFGYQFDTNIDELDWFVYLPSKPFGIGTLTDRLLNLVKINTKGIPNPEDYGYVISDAMELCETLFNARYVIIDDTVHLYPDDDPFWVKESSYTLPDILLNEVRFNTQDLRANRLYRFETDISDTHTITEFEGTNIETITTPITTRDERKNGIRGLEDLAIPMALGKRKGELNVIEEAILAVAGFAEDAVNIFGANKDFRSKIKQRVDFLKMSSDTFTVPKLLYIPGDDGLIPEDHLDFLSARALDTKFYSSNSFIQNSFQRQRFLFENVTISPFRQRDFNVLIKNSYFKTNDGKTGKFESLDWNPWTDEATADFWISLPYTKNLEETVVEPT